jgi:chromosome segregation ATPase
MGRKRNPLGKDRNRTIQLDGDVADKAQALADEGKLSRKISELLRYHYQIDSEVSRLESQLNDLIDKRKEMQGLEEELIAKIDSAKHAKIHRKETELPNLYAQLHAIRDNIKRARQKMQISTNYEAQRLNKVIDTNHALEAKVMQKIEELES